MRKVPMLVLLWVLVFALSACNGTARSGETEIITTENPEEVTEEITEDTTEDETEPESEAEQSEKPEETEPPADPPETTEDIADKTETTAETAPALSVEWAEKVNESVPEFEEYIAPDAMSESKIAFLPNETLQNFQVLELEFVEADEDGNILFSSQEVYLAGDLSPQRPLFANLSFLGTIPNYGISFTDEAGIAHHYTIGESGKDGSLFLSPFTPQ